MSGDMTGGEDSAVTVVRVREVMTHRLVTIAPETSCGEARRLMDEREP